MAQKPAPMFMDEKEPTPSAVSEKATRPITPSKPSAPPPLAPGRIPCPPPGIYPGVPFETYIAWDAENNSTIRHMKRSPAHFFVERHENGGKETPSKAFGTAEHTLLFEPDRFARLLVAPPINPTTGKPFGRDSQKFEAFAAANPGKLILTDDEVTRLRGSIAAIRACEDAWTYINCKGQSEVCIVWDQPTEHGLVRCKCRVDRLVQDSAFSQHFGWVDLKSTMDASPGDWRKSLIDYGYNTQHAMIDLGCMAHGLPTRGLFIAVESKPYHGVSVYSIGEKTADTSMGVLKGWLHDIAKCRKEGVWPGYYPRIQTIDASEWWFKQFGEGFDV